MKLAAYWPSDRASASSRDLIWRSLGVRFVLATTVCLLVLFGVLLVHNARLTEQALTEPFRLRVESLKPVFSAALADPLAERNVGEIAERLEQARSEEDIVYLVLRDADDRLVAAAGRDPATPLPLASVNVLDDPGVFHSFMLIEAGGHKYGTLNLGISTARLTAYRDDLLARGAGIVALGIVLIGAIQVWLAMSLSRRLRLLTAASEDLTCGRYDGRLDESGADEIARLAASMNAMSGAVRDRISQLRESEARLRLAMEAGAVVPWERDLLRDRLQWGPGAERLLGPLPAGAADYPDLLEMVHPEDREHLVQARRKAIRSNSQYHCDIRIRALDGTGRWLSIRGRYMEESDAKPGRLMGVARDITAGKVSELEILRLNQELEQRVRERTAELETAVNEQRAANHELEAFSYSVSHDLRAPLRAISGMAGILCEDFAHGLPHDAVPYLNRINENARQMGRLIDGLLRFSQVGRAALERAPVDMRTLAESVLRDLRHGGFDESQVRIGELPPASGDATLLRQVWQNLIGNAFKFTRDAAAPRIEIGGSKLPQRGVEYWVCDNGAGFDPAYAHKLFGVFQRLHSPKEFEGTGVGLALVQRIVARHGGTVEAEGRPGEGATFRFFLPDWVKTDTASPGPGS